MLIRLIHQFLDCKHVDSQNFLQLKKLASDGSKNKSRVVKSHISVTRLTLVEKRELCRHEVVFNGTEIKEF